MQSIFSLHGLLFILIAIVARFIIGSLWYSKFLFQKPWMKAQGKSADYKPAGGSAGPAMAIMSVMLVISTILLALFVMSPLGGSIVLGIITALMIWIGFILPTHIHYRIFSLQNPQPSWKYIMINAGQELVGILVAAIILSLA